MALDPVLESLRALIEMEISLGSFTLTPGDILIFVLVIWVSFKISRLLCFALEADVLPHMHLPRGVPGAVTRLTHYAVIVIGVIDRLLRGGVSARQDHDHLRSVGRGHRFRAPERGQQLRLGPDPALRTTDPGRGQGPTRHGRGRREDIGMRASTIRSYSGAEIVVPNANFVSAEVVNWTLRDRTRRMEIPVGVAYGTDPGSVIDILVDVATKHPQVDDQPQAGGPLPGLRRKLA